MANAGQEPTTTCTFYAAAFDSDGNLVAAGPGGFFSGELAPGQRVTNEAALRRDPFVDVDLDHAEAYIPAEAVVES